MNKYNYTVTLNFSYVPFYGKLALFNQHLMHFEAFVMAGVGGSGTEIVPKDYRYKVFSNPFALTFPVGLGGRVFINKWIAIQASIRLQLPGELSKHATSEGAMAVARASS